MGQKKFGLKRNFGPEKLGLPKILVKNESDAGELFLMWTNVDWTNVTVKVIICSKCFQDPSFKVSSKSGQ